MPLWALCPRRLVARVSMTHNMALTLLTFRSFTCPLGSQVHCNVNPLTSSRDRMPSRFGPLPSVSSSRSLGPLNVIWGPKPLISASPMPSSHSSIRGGMPSWLSSPLPATDWDVKPLISARRMPHRGPMRSKWPCISVASLPPPPPPCRLFSTMACWSSSVFVPRRLWLPSPGAAPVSGSAKRVLYEQGQSPEPGIREYFYYIDHLGQLFLDDAKIKNFTSCFKDKKFLVFFFRRLQANGTPRYRSEFPWLSLCGRERNYIHCDDRPVVFTELLTPPGVGASGRQELAFGRAGSALTVPFEPEQLCMSRASGRVYHPAAERFGGVGLVSSDLAMRLSPFFHYESDDESVPPTHFEWQGRTYELTNQLWDALMEGEAPSNSS
uniref:UPF0598 protein C8orf82 homolog n=2 Tax=Petromyzon marinus TaxID=7757 RepID=A0AAJ7X1F8_PETMA|nr:UPF0598 protein C8orf82 homolog [Petromyzon marinus]